MAHYGHVLRVATRGEGDPEALCRRVLGEEKIAIDRCVSARATVEDAFVSMVREDARREVA